MAFAVCWVYEHGNNGIAARITSCLPQQPPSNLHESPVTTGHTPWPPSWKSRPQGSTRTFPERLKPPRPL